MHIGYLFFGTPACHNIDIAKKYRPKKLQHCAARARITNLKVKWPTSPEMAKLAFAIGNVVKV